MRIISPLQCRGARAILNLSRSELAELSGVAAATIGTFETESAETRANIISRLRTALESAGAEFLDTDGVKMKGDTIRTYEGKNVHRLLLDEIYHDLKETGGEILLKGLTEKKWDEGDSEAFLKNHLDRLIKANITERILVSEEDTVYVAPKHWYRKIPAKYFSLHTQWIFNNKVAMVTWGDSEKLIIIESPNLFNSETRSFNCIWDNVAEPVE
jgi:transcriptional regulator with XRE-family HTH domain